MIDKFQSDHAVKDQMAHQNYRYYLAKLDGEYAGFVGFAPEYQGQEGMYLSKVYLLAECRHQGVVPPCLTWWKKRPKKRAFRKSA